MFRIDLVASRSLARRCGLAVLTVATGAEARAEFKPGDVAPSLTLEAADGVTATT
jgi:hypothetical protein